jgi:type IV secretory pathway VirB10-like protein
MTIKAGGRMALIAATGLLVCVAGVSWTTAASSAPEQKSEYVSTSNKVNQTRYYKRYAHRKYARTAQKSSEEKKPVEVAEAGLPSELPATVANANARMGEITDTARAMTARANALLASDQPTEGQGAVTMQVAEADQLNDADKALQESAQPSQTTVAVAPTKPVAPAKPAPSESSTWDQTSLIGKIFIAFGALLTVASAARMFMA